MEHVEIISVAESPVMHAVARVGRDGCVEQIDAPTQVESFLDIYIDDVLACKIACSKSDSEELVVGFLYTRGFMGSVDEIDRIVVSGNAASVYTKRRALPASRADALAPSHVPCRKNYISSRHDRRRERRLESVTPISWSFDEIFRICDEFALDKTDHARTRCTHSAYLCSRAETVCVRQDIGRHNAFDKCVGWALLHEVDLSQSILYISGRVPVDMAEMAIRARIPILVSKAVATDKAVELAEAYDLTLLCEGKSSGFMVMNDPAHVAS